jgi:prophage DNA circulation protein
MILSDEFTCGRYNQGNIDSVPLSLSTVSMTLTTARLAEAATVAMVSAATNNAAEVDLLGSNLVTIAGQIVATEPSCTSFTNALISLNDTIQATVNDPADQIRLISQLAAYTSDSPYAGSSIVLSVIRRSALVELAKAIAEYNFTSSTDAEAMMEQVIPLFDAEIEIAADNYDNSTYRALKRLRTAVVDDLQTRGSQLPELYDVSFNTSLPVSKIAYMLYQDATRTDEITIRNNPIHPLFMQNTLEVLSY